MAESSIHRQIDRIAGRCGGRRPAAVVLGETTTALAFVRSLGRRGIPVVTLASAAGFATSSRFTDSVILPAVEDHPELWLDALLRLAGHLDDPPVLLPNADALVLFAAAHADALAPAYRFLMPSRDTVERIIDKRAQYEVAERAGLEIPSTRFPRTRAEVSGAAESVGLPCLIKPYRSHVGQRLTGRKLALARTPAEAEAEFAAYQSGGVDAMVQGIVPGDDDRLFCYLGFWDETGRERAWITLQKLRQYPPRFGTGSLLDTVVDDETAEISRDLLRALDYRGIGCVELKRDPRDGSMRLIEVNPRAFASTQLAVTAGVDLPMMIYRHLTEGVTVDVAPSFRVGMRYVQEELDLKSYLVLRRSRSLRLGAWLRSRRRIDARGIGAWDDPLPLALTAVRAIAAWLRALVTGAPWRGSAEPHADGDVLGDGQLSDGEDASAAPPRRTSRRLGPMRRRVDHAAERA